VVLSRPYPRAAPGRLVSLQSDGDATTLQLTGVAGAANPGAKLDLWVPDRGSGRPAISGTGLGATTIIDVAGGFRVLVEVSGSYAVAVELR
jgi:endoglycosylceramidase